MPFKIKACTLWAQFDMGTMALATTADLFASYVNDDLVS